MNDSGPLVIAVVMVLLTVGMLFWGVTELVTPCRDGEVKVQGVIGMVCVPGRKL